MFYILAFMGIFDCRETLSEYFSRKSTVLGTTQKYFFLFVWVSQCSRKGENEEEEQFGHDEGHDKDQEQWKEQEVEDGDNGWEGSAEDENNNPEYEQFNKNYEDEYYSDN